MQERIPSIIAAICVMVYWGNVATKAYRHYRRSGKDPNVIPREKTGQIMRLVWIPTVLAWVVHGWVSAVVPEMRLAGILVPLGTGWPRLATGYAGAAVCLIATRLTFICWHEMGKSWRIGIDPNEKTELVFSGPYRWVRHPIYALFIANCVGSLLATPTVAMLCTAVINVAMLQIEARREERYLVEKHGAAYQEYRRKVGRFIPRLGGS